MFIKEGTSQAKVMPNWDLEFSQQKLKRHNFQISCQSSICSVQTWYTIIKVVCPSLWTIIQLWTCNPFQTFFSLKQSLRLHLYIVILYILLMNHIFYLLNFIRTLFQNLVGILIYHLQCLIFTICIEMIVVIWINTMLIY